jgi:hypothetical protein
MSAGSLKKLGAESTEISGEECWAQCILTSGPPAPASAPAAGLALWIPDPIEYSLDLTLNPRSLPFLFRLVDRLVGRALTPVQGVSRLCLRLPGCLEKGADP